MTAREHEKLRELLASIEEQLNWGPSSGWKQRDFEALGDRILEKTKVSISLSTLKRLWKLQYRHLPQPDTLNALARFAGFGSWQDFVARDKPFRKLRTRGLWKKRLLILAAALLLALGIHLVRMWLQSRENSLPAIDSSEIIFTAASISDAVPNTVIFKYRVPGIQSDSLYIQQSWDPRRRERVSGSDSIHTSIYYYPGHFNASLIYRDSVLKQFPLQISTRGWQALTTESGRDDIPTYIPFEEVYSEGELYLSPETLKEYNVDLRVISQIIHFFYSRPFDSLDCANLIFETRVKNSLKEGALTCQQAHISLHFENGRTRIPLSLEGCVSDLDLVYNDYYESGKNSDLSAFGVDMEQWQVLKVEARGKEVSISINGKEVRSFRYSQHSGRLKYLQYRFHGCGRIDYAQLADTSGVVHFRDVF